MCLRVSSCCGCGDLQTGCQRIAIASIVFAILGLLGNLTLEGIFGAIFGILFAAALYYGAKERKPAFLVAWLVIVGIELAIIGIAILVLGGAMIFGSKEIMDAMSDQMTPEQRDMVGMAIGIVIFIFLVAELITAYFFAVVWSFYKEITEEHFSGVPDAAMAEKGYAK